MRRLLTVVGLGLALAGCAPWGSSPEPVTLDSEYFEVVPLGSHRFPAGTDTFPGEGLLLSPHYMVRLERIEVTDVAPEGSTWGPDHASSRPKAAAAGHEFVIVRVAFDWNLVRWRPTVATTPDPDYVSLSISIGEREQAFDELPSSGYELIVSAPEGAKVWLRVTDAGRTQSLNLRDGARGDDAHEGFYTRAKVTLSPADYTGTGVVTAFGMSRPLEIKISVYAAVLVLWTPALGWLDDADDRWLHVTIGTISSNALIPEELGQFPVDLDLDLGRTFTLILPDGTEVAPASSATVDVSIHTPLDGVSVAFPVTADFQGGTLVVTPEGEMTALFKDAQPEVTWSQRPAPGELAVQVST